MAKPTPIEMEKYLKGVDYPASKEDLLESAKRNGAEQQICEVIQSLPDRCFEKPTDVTKALSVQSQNR